MGICEAGCKFGILERTLRRPLKIRDLQNKTFGPSSILGAHNETIITEALDLQYYLLYAL